MCTAIRMKTQHTYCGRNLDLSYSYDEEVVILPRRFELSFRAVPSLATHFAMVGTAFVPDETPLYYDAVNERGLMMIALNFPKEARYTAPTGQEEIAPFEVIPFVLSQCDSVKDATALLATVRIAAVDYSAPYPTTPLHWFLADEHEAAAVEPTEEGLVITANPMNVLTNSPSFDEQAAHLVAFEKEELPLPGDWSSTSRFVRAAVVTAQSVCEKDAASSVSQMFHLLSAVAVPRGAKRDESGRCVETVYSACCDISTGEYYYQTYDGGRYAVSLFCKGMGSETLLRYPFIKGARVTWQN